ncbi:MAG: hypothetical protein K2X53_02180, partial [Alphaproteobacteria bacterium]|nr:hypothetical protein [Alphaproteobacteria bacterium]
MQFNSIASILILSVSAASISALDASNFLQEQDYNQSRGSARKRTAQEITQEPSFGDRVCDVARSLYSVGSSLGSLGWSVGALTFTGFKAVGSFAQTSLSAYQNPERTQFRAAVARPHLMSAMDQRMDQPQLHHAPRFKSAAPDILPGRVLSYVALHKDIITLEGVNYRVHFDMQSITNNSAIDDKGELCSRIKVSLLHFEKFKEKDNAIHYMAVGSNEHNTMLAYSRAYPGLRMYVTLTKEETRPLNLL